jgi:hypothetical protein
MEYAKGDSYFKTFLSIIKRVALVLPREIIYSVDLKN